MAKFPIFSATSGLNNVLEAHRLRYGEDGGCPLAEAIDVIIDDGGGVRRRKGRQKLFSGPVHSLWSWGEYCFFVSAGALHRRLPGGTNVLVNPSCGDAPMFFTEFGGKVFCSNGSFRAILHEMTITAWVASVPEKFRSDTRLLGLPPTFTKVFRHTGRMFFVDGMHLWESEPFEPGCVDLATGYRTVGENIIEAIPVRGGIYISTATRVMFLAGTSIEDFIITDVHPSPMIPGTADYIVADQVGNGDMVQGIAAIWTSRDGVCVGSDKGDVSNVTIRSLAFDKATSGAGVVIPGQYFFSLEVE